EVVAVPARGGESPQSLPPRRIGETHTLLPSRVAPILVLRKLRVGVGRVVDHHLGTFDQWQNIRIAFARAMFSVSDVRNNFASVFDPVAGCPVRMIERPRMQAD